MSKEKEYKSWTCDETLLINNRFVKMTYNHGGAAMGRCGGGWEWKFGAMGVSSGMVIELTFFTIRINFKGSKE